MKIRADQALLQRVVSNAAKAAGSIYPQNHILFDCQGPTIEDSGAVAIPLREVGCKIVSQNPESTLEIAASGVTVEIPGTVAVPAKILSEVVSAMPAGQLILEWDGTRIEITSGRSKMRLPGASADSITRPRSISGTLFTLPFADFCGMVKQTVDSVFIETDKIQASRPWTLGVNFRTLNGKLHLAGCNEVQLVRSSCSCDAEGLNFIVPPSPLEMVCRANCETLEVVSGERGVCFKAGESTITSRLIDATYVDWVRMFDKPDPAYVLLLDRKELQGCLKRLFLVFGNDGFRKVHIDRDGDQLRLSSFWKDNQAEEFIGCGEQGMDRPWAIAGNDIDRVCKLTDAEQIQIDWYGPLDPMFIRIPGDENILIYNAPMERDRD